MSPRTIGELKKALIASGFEVYRTIGDRVRLADRVRENLILDSGVSAVLANEELRVEVVVRAQASDFPGESNEDLFTRARSVAQRFLDESYEEIGALVQSIPDPGEKARTLDQWCEVTVARRVNDIDCLMAQLKMALNLEKVARR